MQPSNGKPLTQAGVKAIVKEVTGHDATRVLGQNINMGGSQVIHTSHRPTSLFIFKFFFLVILICFFKFLIEIISGTSQQQKAIKLSHSQMVSF